MCDVGGEAECDAGGAECDTGRAECDTAGGAKCEAEGEELSVMQRERNRA